MRVFRLIAASAAAVALAACGDDDPTGNASGCGGATVTVSQAVADRLSGVLLLAADASGNAQAELAATFASFALELHGNTLCAATISTNLGGGAQAPREYATIGLQFVFRGQGAPPQNLTGMLAFRDTTEFIALVSPTGGGSFGGASASFGGLSTVAGAGAQKAVSSWTATAGSMNVTGGDELGDCRGALGLPRGVTCRRQRFTAAFDISASSPSPGQGNQAPSGSSRTASLATAQIDGIRLDVNCDEFDCGFVP